MVYPSQAILGGDLQRLTLSSTPMELLPTLAILPYQKQLPQYPIPKYPTVNWILLLRRPIALPPHFMREPLQAYDGLMEIQPALMVIISSSRRRRWKTLELRIPDRQHPAYLIQILLLMLSPMATFRVPQTSLPQELLHPTITPRRQPRP